MREAGDDLPPLILCPLGQSGEDWRQVSREGKVLRKPISKRITRVSFKKGGVLGFHVGGS